MGILCFLISNFLIALPYKLIQNCRPTFYTLIKVFGMIHTCSLQAQLNDWKYTALNCAWLVHSLNHESRWVYAKHGIQINMLERKGSQWESEANKRDKGVCVCHERSKHFQWKYVFYQLQKKNFVRCYSLRHRHSSHHDAQYLT